VLKIIVVDIFSSEKRAILFVFIFPLFQQGVGATFVEVKCRSMQLGAATAIAAAAATIKDNVYQIF